MSTNRRFSLVELQQEFAQWRSHRQGQCIPQWIRVQAMGLLGQHWASEIKAALGINHDMLKQWKAQCNNVIGTDKAVQRSDFVALPPLASCQYEEPLEAVLSLTLSRYASDGSAVSFTPHLPLRFFWDFRSTI